MSNQLETIRHSSAHLLAAAVQALYPKARFGVGPVIENGFYYDIDLGHKFTLDDLGKIEKKMNELKAADLKFARQEMTTSEAIKLFKKLGQTYKVELLNDLKKHGTTVAAEIYGGDEKKKSNVKCQMSNVAIYRTGEFIDLCRGPHVKSAKDIPVFKLLSVAGAYWRGSEKNKQLQRIYGTAWATQPELAEHLRMIEEAEKRDHKKLGPQLDLFVFSDLVGPGLPLWTPKGAILRDILDDFIWELRQAAGYTKVEIPHIAKKDLYVRSGHWDKFKNDLLRIATREGREFALKPMNCPHHTQIFARKPHSYREMPQRYTNTTMVYRDEQTGELSGLSRVRCITQDDSHVFCRASQIKDEIMTIWDMVDKFYGAFGFTLQPRLSLSDPDNTGTYLGEPKAWQNAENVLRAIAKDRKTKPIESVGEAAFYGPKLDFMAKDSIGREWQVATIQLDFNMPERFGLECANEKGENERVVMIHCAIMGSIERFLSILIEHFSGAFPAWLSPVQVAILPVASAKHLEFARQLADKFKQADVRVALDDADETVGKKIRNAELQKIPYILVVGDKEMSGDKLAVRERGKKDTALMGLDTLVEEIKQK